MVCGHFQNGCLTKSLKLKAWMSNYIPLFDEGVIIIYVLIAMLAYLISLRKKVLDLQRYRALGRSRDHVQFYKSDGTLWGCKGQEESEYTAITYTHSESKMSYNITTMTSQWARWRLKSPASRLFTQPFIRAQIKVNIKAPRHWPLCGNSPGTGEFPAQMASNAENVSIWWRHHVMIIVRGPWYKPFIRTLIS